MRFTMRRFSNLDSFILRDGQNTKVLENAQQRNGSAIHGKESKNFMFMKHVSAYHHSTYYLLSSCIDL